MNGFRILGAVALLSVAAQAQTISGTISVSRKLTHRSVTATIPVYDRGTAVGLGKPAETDPLAYERSRVVLYLEGPGLSAQEPGHKYAMMQKNRQFAPDILAVPVGATVSFPNQDPIFHNVFSLSSPKSFDLGVYDKGDSRNVTFSKPGIVFVFCHLHPNMAATIVVTPSRYYAQVDDTGHYAIPNIPPGHYTLVAWHKAAGFSRRPVTVERGHDLTEDFSVPLALDEKEQNNAHKGAHGP